MQVIHEEAPGGTARVVGELDHESWEDEFLYVEVEALTDPSDLAWCNQIVAELDWELIPFEEDEPEVRNGKVRFWCAERVGEQEFEWAECTCGHHYDDHDGQVCGFKGCGCGAGLDGDDE